ncbi:YdhK family protein [Brevibacterium spongiae]|uniref:YdhK family protein n=1 Tax=Brevibacterium spongiae TaxID=2909672 RepID=A0ABY5SQ05_9MICO|nr:YdhK family protein [Brevibacterium spongiae]UVI35238.1 YdhK family protein [Brevibacterium spongiae]
MKKSAQMMRLTAVAAAIGLALAGCSAPNDEAQESGGMTTETAASESAHDGDRSDRAGMKHEDSGSDEESGGHEGMNNMDGGAPPKGIEKAADPKFEIGDDVVLTADHMPGMKNAPAKVTGAFDTTAYEISYTPTDGGEPVKNHKWVVHEELENPGQAPLKEGTEITVNADHMPGLKGAKATIDSSTDETVYMVDVNGKDMSMTNHKWMVESEMKPAK